MGGLSVSNGTVDFSHLDGAKALVKLALSGLGCPSLPDVFHLLYALSKSISLGDSPSTGAIAKPAANLRG